MNRTEGAEPSYLLSFSYQTLLRGRESGTCRCMAQLGQVASLALIYVEQNYINRNVAGGW